MGLTNNTLPAIIPQFTLPLDTSMQFASAQTIAATGYVNNTNAVVGLGLGRCTGMLALDISTLKVSAGNETYQFSLIGSNDAAFGNGNCDLLAFHDFTAATAGRIIATILAASPTVPPTNLAGTLVAIPFTNLMQGYVYQYTKLYVTEGGTAPTCTLSAWIAPIEMKV